MSITSVSSSLGKGKYPWLPMLFCLLVHCSPEGISRLLAPADAQTVPKVGRVGISFKYRRDQEALIVSVRPESPAFKAGIEKHDLIVAVDGKLVSTMDEDEIVRSIAGPAGTTVNLVIRHQNIDKTYTLERTNSIDFVDPALRRLAEWTKNTQFPLLTQSIERNTYIQSKLHFAIARMATSTPPADTESYFQSAEWATGKTPAEKAADRAVALVYAAFVAMELEDHVQFLAILDELSPAYKALTPDDRRLLCNDLILALGDPRARGQFFDKSDAMTLLCLSMNLSEPTSMKSINHSLFQCRSNVVDSLFKSNHLQEAELLAKINVEESQTDPGTTSDATGVIRAFSQLCDIYIAESKYSEAEKIAEKPLELLAKQHKQDSLPAIPARCRIALLAIKYNRLASAKVQVDAINNIIENSLSTISSSPAQAQIPPAKKASPLAKALNLLANRYDSYLSYTELDEQAATTLDTMLNLYLTADCGKDLLPLYQEAIKREEKLLYGDLRNSKATKLLSQLREQKARLDLHLLERTNAGLN